MQIGAAAGADIALPSAALRQANLHFLGSGQGSISAYDILSNLPSLVEEIDSGTFTVDAVAKPLAEVEAIWLAKRGSDTERIVLEP